MFVFFKPCADLMKTLKTSDYIHHCICYSERYELSIIIIRKHRHHTASINIKAITKVFVLWSFEMDLTPKPENYQNTYFDILFL